MHLSRDRPVSPRAARHLASLVATILGLSGLSTLLVSVPDALQASHAVLQGATYTDIHVQVPMLQLLGIVTLSMRLGAARRATQMAASPA